MPFSTYFSYITAASTPTHAFLEFFLPVLCKIFFPSHRLLSHITIIKTMDSSERGMNPVPLTINHPGKEYWPNWRSNQQPPQGLAKGGLIHLNDPIYQVSHCIIMDP